MKVDVSVVIPTHNRARLALRAIQSVVAQADEVLAVEALVVDDGSTDETAASVSSLSGPVKLVRLPSNRGRNIARNMGLDTARGEFVKFLDSDDYLEPGSLKRETNIARDQAADVVASAFRDVRMDRDGNCTPLAVRLPPALKPPVIDALLAGEAVPTSAALYRRSYLGDLRWDTDLYKLDDWDWFIRACLLGGRVVTSPEVSYSWCHHEFQSIRTSTMLENALGHHAILHKFRAWLEANDCLTPARRRRLAQYLYKEVRVLCLEDRPRFEAAMVEIFELDPSFVPVDEERQAWMRWLCRALGTRNAILMHSWIKSRLKPPARISEVPAG